MVPKRWFRLGSLLAVTAGLALSGCEDDPVKPAEFEDDAVVFSDEYGSAVTFQAFQDSKYDAVTVDVTERYAGSASLKVAVPGPGDPTGTYAGGAFTTTMARDLSEYNALTFWAKASQAIALNVAGLGNNNTGTSMYEAKVSGLELATTWAQYTIPIPLPEKLVAEDGLFFFAEGAEGETGYTIWFDEIEFQTVSALPAASPEITAADLEVEVGGSTAIAYSAATYAIGDGLVVEAQPYYFTFSSSDESVATVAAGGIISVVGEGEASITAELGTTPASGGVNLATFSPPTTAPDAPTVPAEEVISLFSDTYTDNPVDTWSAEWDVADVADVQIAGNTVKKYSNLSFAGIEFTSQMVDAASNGLTHLHMDLWVTDATAFNVKLVDFGADGAFGGGDDSEHEITLAGAAPGGSGPRASSPDPLTAKSWNSVDIPLADFTGLTGTGHLAQMVLSGSSTSVYLDNIYFFVGEAPQEPATAAPTPTYDAGDVVSLFSNPYTDVAVDTWSAEWDQADVTDLQIAGDDTKKYTGMAFAGIEFTSQTVDASGTTHFRMDIWTPDATDTGVFKVKLVDFGGDGAWGGGDDTEHELTFDASTTPALATGTWVSLDVPLSNFTGLAGRAHLAQLIISGDPNTVYVDNVLFYSATPTEPSEAAPTPAFAAEDVISLFSDAYTDVTVDRWSTDWDQTDLADVQVAENATKLYTNLAFAGIEFTSQTIDASGMTHFHLHIWTPDPASTSDFKVKLVDFGADGGWGGGDDTEHELTFNAGSEPALASGTWVTLDLPLASFTNLTATGHMAQLIISGAVNTVYVDNVLFHK